MEHNVLIVRRKGDTYSGILKFGLDSVWYCSRLTRGIKAVASTAVPQGITSSTNWEKLGSWEGSLQRYLRETQVATTGRGRPSLPRSRLRLCLQGQVPSFPPGLTSARADWAPRVFFQEVPASPAVGSVRTIIGPCREWICLFLLPHVLRPPVSLVGLSKWKTLEISLVWTWVIPLKVLSC